MMLWKVYMGLTVVGIVLLVFGGMSVYNAIAHIFAAVSTGGFSTHNASVAFYNSAYIDYILTLIMFLSGANFNLHLAAIRGRSLRPYRDSEFRFYTVLVAASIFKPGLWNIILILGFVDWPGIARLVRGNVLSLRETNFIKGNIVAGMPLRHILFSEILPNTAAPILVYATSVLALSMLDEAALSFLGMGVQPPTASLGNMLNGAQSLTVLTKQPWLWIPPGLLIVVLVIAINFIGDALRDALDPNSRN